MKVKLEYLPIGFNSKSELIVAEDAAGFLVALRDIRDVLLKECDWVQNSDCQLADDVKQEWLEYRQALRDFPKAFNEENIVPVVDFPVPPVVGRPRTWVNLEYKESADGYQ